MAYKFKLPELGEGMAEGEIASWLVKEGDTVKEDDSLVEIQNDKSVEELPSPVSGTVKQILAKEGDTVEIGDTLIVIDDGSADTGDDATPAPKADEKPAEKAAAPATSGPATGAANAHYLAMPSVRQYARDQGVDLSQVTPSGKHGQISKTDIDSYKSGNPAAVAQPAASTGTTQQAPAAPAQPITPYKSATPELETREKMSLTRKAIAKAMLTSKHTAPHVTSFDDVEVSALMANRKKYKAIAADKGIHLTFLPYIVKAMVAVMKAYPELNASIDDSTDEIVYKHYYNVGIATNTEHGLYVPNDKNVDSKGMFEIAKEIIGNVRTIRAQKNISMKEELELQIVGANPVEALVPIILKMCNLSAINVVEGKTDDAVAFMVGTIECAVPLGSMIDMEAELMRMEAELKHKEGFLQGVLKKLSNERFVNNAPVAVLEMERKKQADAESIIGSLKESIEALKSLII